MNNVLRMLALTLVVTAGAYGAEAVKLEPNAILPFEFPDLPDTLATMASGEKQPARLTAQLPENYSRDGRFPLCVYLDGGKGGERKSGLSLMFAVLVDASAGWRGLKISSAVAQQLDALRTRSHGKPAIRATA